MIARRAVAVASLMLAAACGGRDAEAPADSHSSQNVQVEMAADPAQAQVNSMLRQTFVRCPEGFYYQYRRTVSRRYTFGTNTSGLEMTTEVRAYGLEQTSEADRLNGIARRLTIFVDTGPFRFAHVGQWDGTGTRPWSDWQQPESEHLLQFQLSLQDGQWQVDFDPAGAPGHLAPLYNEFEGCEEGFIAPLDIPLMVSSDFRQLTQTMQDDRR